MPVDQQDTVEVGLIYTFDLKELHPYVHSAAISRQGWRQNFRRLSSWSLRV